MEIVVVIVGILVMVNEINLLAITNGNTKVFIKFSFVSYKDNIY